MEFNISAFWSFIYIRQKAKSCALNSWKKWVCWRETKRELGERETEYIVNLFCDAVKAIWGFMHDAEQSFIWKVGIFSSTHKTQWNIIPTKPQCCKRYILSETGCKINLTCLQQLSSEYLVTSMLDEGTAVVRQAL